MFDELRKEALEMAKAARSGTLDPQRALAAAACLKVYNDNISVEIDYRKLGLQARAMGVQMPKNIEAIETETALFDGQSVRLAIEAAEAPHPPEKLRLPRILLLGMRPAQVGVVSEKLNGTADLDAWTADEGIQLLRSKAKSADIVIACQGGAIGHSDTELLDKANIPYHLAQNNKTSVLDSIKKALK